MNIKINGVYFVDDFYNLDFEKLKLLDQIIILNEKKEDNVSDIINYIVSDKSDNFLHFYESKFNFDIYQPDEDENYEIDYEVNDDDEISLLYNNDRIFQFNIEYEINEDEIDNQLISNIKSFKTFGYFNSYINNKKFKYIYHFPISDNLYLGYVCDNDISTNIWKCYQNLYLIKNNKYYQLKIENIQQLFDFLKSYTSAINDVEKFENAYKMINYDLKDYIFSEYKYGDLIDLVSFYSDIYILSSDYIRQFFKPIYQVENFISYRYSRYNITYNRLRIDSENLNEMYEINRRISESILKYLYNDLAINPYTGEIIDNNYEEEFRTAEHLILNESGFKFYYIKINDIFCSATNNEVKEIRNIRSTIDTLSGEE